MNTSTKSSISKRKQHHIDVCKEAKGIENSLSAGFEALQFIHTALPELSLDQIETETEFLGHAISFPFFISCMTGGSEEGKQANRTLAKVAQEMRVPIGLGSIRVLFEHPEREADFSLRTLCPDVPILANIGAVQLRDCPSALLIEWIKRLEVDALVVHLNPAQELFQEGGDLDFRGLLSAIEEAHFSVPIIVKETGFGIRPSLVKKLFDRGAAFVDLAASGGTNWVLVEDPNAKNFASWGIPTAPLLDACREFSGKVLASGGLRSGVDLAKSIALGAKACGMALPVIQAALVGEDAAFQVIEQLKKDLKATMLLTGSKTLKDLNHAPLIRSLEHINYVQQLKDHDL